jgi:hypothetical protein
MITKEQALTANDFHENHTAIIQVGPRGGQTMPKIYHWRRNGKTHTWKRSPDRFQVPIKFGMYSTDYLTEANAHMFHTPWDCPKMILSTDLGEGMKINIHTERGAYLKATEDL